MALYGVYLNFNYILVLNQFRVYQPNGPIAAAVENSDQFNHFIAENYLAFYQDEINATILDVDQLNQLDQLNSNQSYEVMRRLMTDILYRVPALNTAISHSEIKDTVKLLYLNTPDFFDQYKFVPISLLLFGNLFNPMVRFCIN